MSQENVEVVEAALDAFNTGDIEGINAFIDPDFETSVPPEFSAEPDTYHGQDGMRRYFASFHDAMDDISFRQESVIEAGMSVVVALRLTAKGRTTGIPVEQRLAQVWTLSDGKIVRIQSYASLPEALATLGLEG